MPTEQKRLRTESSATADKPPDAPGIIRITSNAEGAYLMRMRRRCAAATTIRTLHCSETKM